MSDLVKQDTLLSRVDVEVLSKANPAPSILRVARLMIERTPSLRELFAQARSEGWASGKLSDVLFTGLTPFFLEGAGSEEAASLRETCVFLADEYLQIGDSLLLISSDTGRALARLTDKDFYQAQAVPRPDGRMVAPGLRVRPEVESFLVQWQFDRAHEQVSKEELLARVPGAKLLRDSSERSVLFATRAGRQVLLSEVREKLPEVLPAFCHGPTRSFYDCIQVVKTVPNDSSLTRLGDVKSYSRVTYPLMDKKSKNLRHDMWTGILSSTASGWTREVATHLLKSTKDLLGEPVEALDLKWLSSEGLYLASPNVAWGMSRMNSVVEVLPLRVPDDRLVWLYDSCGYLVLNDGGYNIESREVFDRWEVTATFSATLWVRTSLLRVYNVTGVPETGNSVEVVR